MIRSPSRALAVRGAPLLVLVLGIACGGGGGAPPDVVTRVEVSPAAVLLPPGAGPVQLAARALTGDGRLLARSVRWSALTPSVVAVSAEGKVSAMGALGSGQVVAEVDGVAAPPVLVVVATPAAGAMLVDDARVVGALVALDPPAAGGLGWRYQARLAGLPPLSPGELIVGTGGLPLGGRVVAVEAAGADQLVTLAVVAAHELFERLVVKETFDLSAVEPVLTPEASSRVGLRRVATGGWRVEPLSWTATEPPFGIPNVGPFRCELNTEVPIIEVTIPTFRLTPTLTADIDYDSDRPAGQRLRELRVHGGLEGEIKVQARLSPAAALKLTCEAKLATIPLPLNGPLATVFGANAPIGLGAELEAGVSLDLGGYDLHGTLQSSVDVGLSCPAGAAECAPIADVGGSASGSLKAIRPPADVDAVTVKLTGSGYAIAKLAFGVGWVEALNMEAIEVKAGVRSSVDYRAMAGQAADPDYHSRFLTEAFWEAEAASTVKSLADWLEVKWLTFKAGEATALGEFPKGMLAVQPAVIPVDGTATATVTLEGATYLGIPAVVRVDVLRERPLSGGGVELVPVCSATPASTDQVLFSCQHAFGQAEAGRHVLRAFVRARDVAIELSLEVGDDAKAELQVGEPPVTVFDGVYAGLRLGPVYEVMRASGPSPACAGDEVYPSRFYQFDTRAGTWAGRTFTGAWDETVQHAGIGTSRSVGTLAITVNEAGDAMETFALHDVFTAHYTDQDGTITTETIDIAWRGAPVPVAAGGGIYRFSYLWLEPVDASNLTWGHVVTSNQSVCVATAVECHTVDGGGMVAGISP